MLSQLMLDTFVRLVEALFYAMLVFLDLFFRLDNGSSLA